MTRFGNYLIMHIIVEGEVRVDLHGVGDLGSAESVDALVQIQDELVELMMTRQLPLKKLMSSKVNKAVGIIVSQHLLLPAVNAV
jgi:hypothetical protein